MKGFFKSKKANIFLGITIAVFLWISGVLFLPFLLDDIDTFRASMECSSSDISYGTMLSCLAVDGLTPYFIYFFASLAIGYIVGVWK